MYRIELVITGRPLLSSVRQSVPNSEIGRYIIIIVLVYVICLYAESKERGLLTLLKGLLTLHYWSILGDNIHVIKYKEQSPILRRAARILIRASDGLTTSNDN